ncbi:hypothetical protein V2J09_004711 [Rumex salicifolius]
MLNFHVAFFVISLLLLKPISASTEVGALMDLKSALDPENRYLKTWTVAGDPCTAGEFDGVACNEQGKVANISLENKRLTGKLSPAVAGLDSLSGLYLHFNSLTGQIPREIANLKELTDLYLDVNNLTGEIPPEIGQMQSLQVLQLSGNQLTGTIPSEIGSLKKLTVLALDHNHFNGSIPPTLSNLMMLKAIYLSNNNLSGPIPVTISNIPQLQTFDIHNNSLTGIVPPVLKKLNGGFKYSNNSGLCSNLFPPLRHCSAFDIGGTSTTSPQQPLVGPIMVNQSAESANSRSNCNRLSSCSNRSHISQLVIVFVGVAAATVMLTGAVLLAFLRYRSHKQRIGNAVDASDCRMSTEHCSQTPSPLVSLAYSSGWDPRADGLNTDKFSQEVLQRFRFNMEEVQSATQHFSEASVLGKGSFSTVYGGILRDGSSVAIKSINVSSCKAEEDEFVKGMKLLISLRHQNLVSFKGFCCSRGRGECFLIYEFAPNGTLARFLDASDYGGSTASHVLDWPTRVSIIHGIAKGVHYLHKESGTKPSLVHQNLSAEKILMDHHFNPLITDSGLRKILADDLIYSVMKVSAAMGYLAPEYITTGKFTEKSDVYSFGVIVLQILLGKQKLPSRTMVRVSPDQQHEVVQLEEFIDPNLDGKFSALEASKLANMAMACIHEDPSERPAMEVVVRELETRR